ncbi:MAG: YjbH domain-containing protein, partial [Betaproteobacteria bacterium]
GRRLFSSLALALFASSAAASEPTLGGQAGLVSMPDARFAEEGSWRVGIGYLKPYAPIWSSLTAFPWLEASFRFTRIFYVPAFPSGFTSSGFPVTDYGDYRDKAFDVKLRLLPERGWWPAIAAGAQDVGGGTGLFRSQYVVGSKRIHEFDFTLGYGKERIDGAFGGVRWSPTSFPKWGLVAEYDANDYKNDPCAAQSGAAQYDKGGAVGIEYKSDFWGAKTFAAHGEVGLNAYLVLPLERPEIIPKFQEPPPYTKINPRPTEAQWREDEEHRLRLARALQAQDFRDIRLGYFHGRLEASLTNTRISSMPRAVGRAARTMLSFAPLETREIRVTYKHGTLPVATYSFIHVPLLQRYFNGMASREVLAPYVAIEYAKPGEAREEKDRAETLIAFEEPLPEELVVGRQDADLVAVHGENLAGGRFRLAPGFSSFFNDPSGAFKYDLSAIAAYQRPIGHRRFLQSTLKLSLLENVSDVTQPSNSTLPHVRTDVAEYKRGNDFKLQRLLVNQFFHPGERVYARASAGIYEEMFSGVGGQALYMPASGRWAADLAVDWVKQRDFQGWFGHRDYSTVTAIASLNYRMAQRVTGTVRAGRFLARDEGVRFEVKRRFASGFEAGAWYTLTNGNDITSPGTPDSPYYDKGIFVAWALDWMLAYDTQQTATMSLSPWTRDVGQMVVSPGDLYRLLERPVVQMHELDGLQRFGDRADDYALPRLGADRQWPDFLADDSRSARGAAGRIEWLPSMLATGGILAGSALLDRKGFEEADKRKDRGWMKDGVRFGNALPIAAMGLSGIFAFDESRPQLSDAGVAALEAGGVALVGSSLLKYGFGRSRPTSGEGRSDFDPGTSEDRYHAFPSRHTAVMWAAVTPYAKEFDMPWLYGVAALTNAARVGSREHWVSDTVAGSLLGYALGHIAWEARRSSRLNKSGPALAIGPGTVGVSWTLD